MPGFAQFAFNKHGEPKSTSVWNFFFLFGVLAALGIRDTAYGSRDVTNYVGKKNQQQQACIVTVAYDLK